MQKSNGKVPILCIYATAYLLSQGIHPELVLKGSRVVFEFEISADFYRHITDYNNNKNIPALDFANNIRQLKARMMALKK